MTATTDASEGRPNRGPTDDGPLADIGEALEAFARGEILVVVDDEDRENEGDLVMAAQYITPELKALPAVFPPKDVQAKLTQLTDLTPAQRRLRNRMWTEIKAR